MSQHAEHTERRDVPATGPIGAQTPSSLLTHANAGPFVTRSRYCTDVACTLLLFSFPLPTLLSSLPSEFSTRLCLALYNRGDSSHLCVSVCAEPSFPSFSLLFACTGVRGVSEASVIGFHTLPLTPSSVPPSRVALSASGLDYGLFSSTSLHPLSTPHAHAQTAHPRVVDGGRE